MSSGHARRAKIRSRTRAFLAVANKAGIEKIEAKIVAGFLTDPPCTHSQRAVQRQLLGWVDTNPEGRHAKAIPAAKDLYDTLFAPVGEKQREVKAPPAQVGDSLLRLPPSPLGDRAATLRKATDEGTTTASQVDVSRPLTELHRHGLPTGRTSLSALMDLLAHADWRSDYEQERAAAPRRHDRGKRYLVDGHDGVPSSSSHSNRGEEHLALALFNRYGPSHIPMEVAKGAALRILDYQVPLKARQGDVGLGKVDLLAIENPNRLAVVELKYAGKGTADNPVKAAIQGLAYAANMEANRAEICEEIRRKHHITVVEAPLLVIVMADAPYWKSWDLARSSGHAARTFSNFLGGIARQTGAGFRVVDLGNPRFEFGLDGQAPRMRADIQARILLAVEP
jgi:hypothetical protein